MNRFLKPLARSVFPTGLRFSVFCPKFLRNRVLARTGLKIADGPFQGMRYLENSVGSVLEPKLLGIYERELRQIIEELVSLNFRTVIDIGAAEGYYAVGLALRLPEASVWAFETEDDGRRLLAELARLNQVQSRIHIHGTCGQEELQRTLTDGGSTVIVCDVEGYEAELLNPENNPSLKGAAILVELHPSKRPGVKELLAERFEATHSIRTIRQQPRLATDYPYRDFPVNLFPSVYLENAVSEFRQPWEDVMEWFWMTPNAPDGD